MEGLKDRQTLFYRTLLATARNPISTTAVDLHLKVKDIEYDIGLIKNYCIATSMQTISSIHKLILKIQQILGSHKIATPIFDHAHPKNHWNNFSLSWISTTMHKTSLFHLLILEIQSILESCDQTGHTHFWTWHLKNFW